MPYKISQNCIAIDADTGQKLTTIEAGSLFYTPKDRENARNQREQQKAYMQRRIQTNELGYFLLLRIKRIPKDITAQTLSRLTMLATFMNYQNKLMLTEHKPLHKKDFPTILNLSDRAAKVFIAEIKGKYLIEKSDGLYLSKEYYRGENQRFKKDAKTKIFIQTVQDLYYRMKPSQHKYFGLIIQLIPYVNTEYNIICSNPEEKNIDLINPLTITDICKLLNYSTAHTGKLIDNICGLYFEFDSYDQALCTITRSNNAGYRIFVNPRIIFNGSNYEKVDVLTTFFPLKRKIRCYS